MLRGVAAVVVVAWASPAFADDLVRVEHRWPGLPADRGLSLEDQITDHLTALGNTLGHHLDLLSHDMFALDVDGRHRRAHVRLGGGDSQHLEVRFDAGVEFEDLTAHVHARIDLAFHGHAVHVELPTIDMAPADYRGDYGVEIRLPVFAKKF